MLKKYIGQLRLENKHDLNVKKSATKLSNLNTQFT